MKVTINEKEQTLTIVMSLQAPTPSASGKTLVVASTHGNVLTGASIALTNAAGQPVNRNVRIGVNAYIDKA